MIEKIKKDFLLILSTAPKKAIINYINSLQSEQEKSDAIRLAIALTIIDGDIKK